MSQATARWRCIVAAGTAEKAERVARRIEHRIGLPLRDLAIERSRHSLGRYEATFLTDVAADDAQAIVALLSQAAQLSPSLRTNGPGETATGRRTITIVSADTFTVPGLTWFEAESS